MLTTTIQTSFNIIFITKISQKVLRFRVYMMGAIPIGGHGNIQSLCSLFN